MERPNKSESIKNIVELSAGKEDLKDEGNCKHPGYCIHMASQVPKALLLHSAFGEIETGDLSTALWPCVVSVEC